MGLGHPDLYHRPERGAMPQTTEPYAQPQKCQLRMPIFTLPYWLACTSGEWPLRKRRATVSSDRKM
eukprot:12923757-Prorocentrum_lima.AAC.1